MTLTRTDFSAEQAKSALIEFLSEVSSPDHVNRLEAAKKEAGGNFVDHMQLVFPILCRIQSIIAAKYGFSESTEGVCMFVESVKQLSKQDSELRRLNDIVQQVFFPKY